MIRFSLIPVGSVATRAFGEHPYVNRIKDSLKKGIPRLYIWGVGDSSVKMVEKISRYKFEGTITTTIKKEYYAKSLATLPCTICQVTMKYK